MCGCSFAPRLERVHSTERPVLRSRVWQVAALLLVVFPLVQATVGVDRPVSPIVVLLVSVLPIAAVLGWAVLQTRRQRRAYEHELTSWAAERATQAERLRIARDLHDLASHGLGLITVRAAAARGLTGRAADAERIAALADIEHAGRQATAELRQMLGVLRSPGEEAPLRPAETMEDLPGIVAAAQASGVSATLDTGDVGEASPDAQLTVCAIVREALANTARHAGPGRAEVAVWREGDAIVVTVGDDGPAPGWHPHPGAGAGLAGLRERLGLFGGTLHAGRADDGYRLIARLPDRAHR